MDFDFVGYFETLATNLKEIGHTASDPRFHRVRGLSDLGEFLARTSSATYPAMAVVDNTDGRIFVNDGDNLGDQRNYSFYLITNYDEHGDYDERETQVAAIRTLLNKIVSRIKYDQRQEWQQQAEARSYGVTGIDLSSFSYFTVDPLGDNCTGLIVNFNTYVQDNSFKYTASDWSDRD